MSFPRYPQYKASGVEWLGDVPEGWEIAKLGHLLTSPACYGVLVPDFEEGGIPMLRITDMENGTADRTQLNTISQTLSAQYSRTIVEEGDVVLSVVGTIGEAFRVNATLAGVNLSRAVARIQTNADLAAEFLCWLFQSIQFTRYTDLVCVGSAQRVLNMGDLAAFRLAHPVATEQTAIAEFLNRETGKIDVLVAEQRRLMELLKEKRQAVISHAVTKGLNPHVPMKPSGIQWLGDVPEGWEVIQIKQASKLESGHTPSRQHPEYWENCTIPWFTLADVWQIRDAKAEYLFDTKEKVSALGLANSSARLLPKNTVILSRTASVGFSGIMAVDMATTQDFANWICGPRLKPEFLLYVLRAMDGEFRRLMMGSTHNTIYMPDIKSLRFGLPPMEQQAEIVEYVREMTSEFDTLTAEAQRAIDLLQERRTALISAAVTGQIDVRPQTQN